MITIPPGTTKKVRLKNLDAIHISNGNGVATLSFEGTQLTASHTGAKTYGPFKTPGQFTISATSGEASYRLETFRNKAAPNGQTVLGPFNTLTNLVDAFNPTTNLGKEALVGEQAPFIRYVSNGVSWVPVNASSRNGVKVGSSPAVIKLDDSGLFGSPFTFEVCPDVVNDPTISIKVDVSFDGGNTYAAVGTFNSYAARRWIKSPEEQNPTHLMIYRVTGTSNNSDFFVGA